MNYLTRVFLDYETAAMRHIHDAYDWHQRVWDAFPYPRRPTTSSTAANVSISLSSSASPIGVDRQPRPVIDTSTPCSMSRRLRSGFGPASGPGEGATSVEA